MSLLAFRPAAAPRLLSATALSLLLLLAFTGTSHAAVNSFCNPSDGPTQTTTYTGPGNWGDGDYWSNGLPDAGCNAVIPAGDTVTLTTTPGTESDTFAGASANSLTINTGATVIVEGVSSDGEQGNVAQATDLNVGVGGLTIASGATLDIEATGNAAASGAEPGQTLGGAANVGVDSASTAPAPVNNMGTINASSSDSSWGESLNVGGTVTNTGSINDQSGLLTFQGQGNLPYVFDNTGTLSIASGASFTMLAGAGSEFNNTGTFANQGTATLQQAMEWIQDGGGETGNPVQITNGETLVDSAGPGSFEIDDCTTGGLTGTIPVGQTITVLGSSVEGGCSGTTLYLGGNNNAAVVNDGTVVLDAAAADGADGIISGGELDNHGTLDATVAAGDGATSGNQLLAPLVNESGATVDVSGGKLAQTSGTSTTNAGTVNVGAGSLWLVQGGSFTNTGTITAQVGGTTNLGQFNLTVGGKFIAGGTLAPSRISGYRPAKGKEFPFITLNGGSVSGRFRSVTGGFAADYAKENAANTPYLGLVYGEAASAGRRPSVGKLSGGVQKLTVKLSCAKGKVCDKYTITATAKKQTIFSASGTVKAGRPLTRTLKLTKAGKALLKRDRKLKVKVVVKAAGKTIDSKSVTIAWKK